MRFLPALLVVLVCGAAVRGQDNSDFPQTGARRPSQGGGGNNGNSSTGNTGNNGNQNTGNPNTGNPNTGNQDTGNQNTGNPNTGNTSASNARDGDSRTPPADPNAAHPNAGNWQGTPTGRNPRPPNGDHGPNDLGVRSNSGGDEPSPMDLDGAIENFATIVDAYVAKKSDDGWWSYVEKKDGKKLKPRRLGKPSVDEDSIKKKDGSGSRYSGLVGFVTPAGGHFTLEFVVDFSGAEWKVVSAQPPSARVSSRR